MILPIIAYGNPVLREVAKPIQQGQFEIAAFISSMWETMYASSGVGLAAPQVNHSIRLFAVDTLQLFNSMDENERTTYPDVPGIKTVFINATILDQSGQPWGYSEGCLSIPKIHEEVFRPDTIRMRYTTEQWEVKEEVFSGLTARVIQHEYDHLEGKLFIDHLTPLKRKLLKGKLADIATGKVAVDYKIKFAV
ncbi:MAG: peptide deformylase [Bacteroidetes bacterium]|nr:peptide deformylase [Bacteroidota bacterium]